MKFKIPRIPQNFPILLHVSILSVNILPFLTASSAAWTSNTLPYLTSNDDSKNPLGKAISPTQEGWLVGILSIGAMVGAIITYFLENYIGKKKTFILFGYPYIIGYLLLAFGNRIEYLYVGRFFSGLGTGCNYAILPTYLAEISPKEQRGRNGYYLTAFFGAGQVYVVGLASFTNVQTISLAILAPTALYILSSFFITESPYYLLQEEKSVECMTLLSSLRSTNFLLKDREFKDMKKYLSTLQESKSFWYNLCHSRTVRKSFVITVALFIFLSFSGQSIVIAYMRPLIIRFNGTLDSNLSSTLVALANFIIPFVLLFTCSNLGRRPVLMTSSMGAGVTLGAIGTVLYFEDSDIPGLFWYALSSFCAYKLFLSVGLSITLNYFGELFAAHIKSKANIYIALLRCLLDIFWTIMFPNLIDWFGIYYVFWGCAAFCLVAVVFEFVFLPETNGKSFNEIQTILES